jgi:uncharacterized metal-binding protein YceD (DUF177 family)
MIINRFTLQEGKTQHYSADLNFKDNPKYQNNLFRNIESCHVECDATDYGDILRVVINIKAEVIGICSYTLEDVPLTIKTNEELDFTDDEDATDDEEAIYVKEPRIDLTHYIYSLICASMPLRVIKKGATLPKDGNGYRVLTEEDLAKEKKNKPDPRWAKLNENK